MKKLTLNGKEAIINIASFRAASNLRKIISRIASEAKIDLEKIELNDGALAQILPLLLKIDSDESFETALFECLAFCAYDKEKITIDTFEKEHNRELYYPLVFACLETNLKSFLTPLLAKFKKVETAQI